MRVDVTNQYAEGISNLQVWRSRYEKSDYPGKILLNLFYRKYTTHFMWEEIVRSYQKSFFGARKKRWDDFQIGFQQLMQIYSQTAQAKTHPILPSLLQNKAHEKVGSISYADYFDKLRAAQRGDRKELEEIEFAYLHYFLTDQLILVWSAIGGTGVSEIDALGQMSGVLIEDTDMSNYNNVELILGQLCTAPFLHENYNPLPSHI